MSVKWVIFWWSASKLLSDEENGNIIQLMYATLLSNGKFIVFDSHKSFVSLQVSPRFTYFSLMWKVLISSTFPIQSDKVTHNDKILLAVWRKCLQAHDKHINTFWVKSWTLTLQRGLLLKINRNGTFL